MHKYIIGIDTGGTYTDAVLLDIRSREVIATAKYPTTHHQLAIGTAEALAALLHKSMVDPVQVASISVSSTLATNAVIENKGARVAVIVIGYVKHFKLPVKAVVYVKGGHNIMGEEEEPLELDYLVELIEGLKKEVDAYGICSSMSIKNPAHELVTEKAIAMLDPKPSFCSHRISNLAGMQERAATAGLHAKLMPIMEDFVKGVEKAMELQNFNCGSLAVSGSGQPLDTTAATKEAALTVASGPACSAHFGSSQCEDKQTALIIDVGGTTTDIAMIENGSPKISDQGCQIGQWKTHVEAVDMQTTGVGGDSLVHVDHKGNLTIGPSRVTPLASASNIPGLQEWLGAGGKSKLIMVHPDSPQQLPDNELTDFLLKNGPATVVDIREATGLGGVPLEKQLEQLSRQRLIYECGFTPTDALHVLGDIELGNRDFAYHGAEILGRQLEVDPIVFSKRVVGKAEELIENLVIDYICNQYWDKSLHSFIATRKQHPVLGVDFTLKLPLIGIGAAARHLLPGVAKSLKTSLVLPEHSEVGNAVGAALIGLTRK